MCEKNENKIVCSNDTLQVVLSLKPFDINAHKVTFDDRDDSSLVIWSVDGQYPCGMLVFDPDNLVMEIESLSIFQNGQKKSLSIDDIKHYFNPRMSVHIGLNGELYIEIKCGDGGEYHSICLSVVSGVIRYAKSTESC